MLQRYQFCRVARDLALSRTARATQNTASRSTSSTPRNITFINTHFSSSMADINLSRKMSAGFNGKINGHETKRPFLIGVSGGTASGKVT